MLVKLTNAGSKGMKKSQSTNLDFPSSPAKKWPANGPGIKLYSKNVPKSFNILKMIYIYI
jgi:hypothetical protein